jgi:two-component system, OmpR family, alkaline phosphatase synthesis response regulator PhoP
MADRKLLRILVVDDDGDILDLLKYNLEKEGFKIKTLANSNKTIAVAKAFSPDLIILDIMMPHPNGIELCRELRSMKRFENTYIFFLTARSERYYQQAALNTGGDDYIEKVIGLRALTYKVSAVLKNNFIIRKSVPELSIGGLKINQRSGSVRYQDHQVFLSRPELELLFFFAQNSNKVISVDNLIHIIWGSEVYLLDSSVELYIDNLRKKIGLNIIQCVNANRYKFIVH